MNTIKKTNENGLQRFTNFKHKSTYLWGLNQVTFADMEILTELQKRKFLEEVNKKQLIAEGEDKDKLLYKFELMFTEETKRQIWDYNHTRITVALTNLIIEKGRMPCKVDIQERTGLSRVTIDKHLKEYQNNPEYIKRAEQFTFLGDKVLAKVFSLAVNGDIKACKLYLECMGKFGTSINTQNNYIQINGLTISQEQIKNLQIEQLKQIQNILTENDQ